MKTRALVVGIALCASSVFATTYVVPHDDVLINKADAIVIARAIESYANDTGSGIETVTVFSVDEVLKGDRSLANGATIHLPGGVIEGPRRQARFKVIPGIPRFVNGERLVLFLSKRGNGDYSTTDLALGFFGFATDDLGHRVLLRAEGEIHGWDADGSLHREQRRDADRFLSYIRNIAGGRPASPDYLIEANPLVGESGSIAATTRTRIPTTMTCSGCSVLQYTESLYLVGQSPCNTGNAATQKTCVENGPPTRWPSFPTAVNFNRGNTETNAGNGGSDAINAAFTAWNGDANSNVNYVLATTNANTNGILEAADGVNNIVFEKDMSGSGVPNYSCSGGVLGIGGISSATSSGGTSVEGQAFYKTIEGDVSMNKGVGACIGGLLSTGDFNSAVTHEVGHTLGFRHADKTRENSDACTTFATYDCATSAIMTSVVTSGINATLQAWDARAVARIYPSTALPAPTGVTATAASATSVTISWNAVTGAVNGSTVYQVHRSADRTNFSQVCTATAPTVTCNDTTASANTAYLYEVRADPSGTFSSTDLATTVIFTDDPLSSSIAVKTTHITQLRTAVDAVRKLANNGVANNYSYTDSTLTGGTTFIKGVHLTDLRTALDAARSSLSLSALSYTDTTINSSVKVKAQHFTELRNGVK